MSNSFLERRLIRHGVVGFRRPPAAGTGFLIRLLPGSGFQCWGAARLGVLMCELPREVPRSLSAGRFRGQALVLLSGEHVSHVYWTCFIGVGADSVVTTWEVMSPLRLREATRAFPFSSLQ